MYSENEFSFVCNDSICNTCFKDDKSYCLSCEYKSSLTSHNGKTCFEKETDLTTENPTEPMTETPVPPTEPMTETLTIPPTDPMTETPTIPPTEKITEEFKKDINECSNKDIINNKCSSGSINDEQLSQLYNDLKNNYLMLQFFYETIQCQYNSVDALPMQCIYGFWLC